MNENDKTDDVPDVKSVEGRPECDACGDMVKLTFHNGVPTFAKHCKECFAELRYGKIPKFGRRKPF